MQTLEQWLARSPSGRKPKKPIPKVTKKRAKANREYAVRRKAFLEAHPSCEAHGRICEWLHENDKTAWLAAPYNVYRQLRSAEIHHTRKPKCKYLNDESTWLAVCRWSHLWIEDHKDVARRLGLLI